MTMTCDLSDIPAVAAADLAAAMQALIADERGLALINGLSGRDLDTVQAALKRRFAAEPQRAFAAFVRFRHLVEVFAARRLTALFLDHGHALLAPALAIAASLRLNANRGFNPQAFVMSLKGASTANVVPLPPHRTPAVAHTIAPLAA